MTTYHCDACDSPVVIDWFASVTGEPSCGDSIYDVVSYDENGDYAGGVA